MVWFQCDDCGETLKKPKLAQHFQRCSAYRLACIDCGVNFSQQTAQSHTTCISEMEKYGPKGQSSGAAVASAGGAKSEGGSGSARGSDGVDLSVGLSTRPPWKCSLCHVSATSEEVLAAHAQGKKHRGKARGAAAAAASAAAAAAGGEGAAAGPGIAAVAAARAERAEPVQAVGEGGGSGGEQKESVTNRASAAGSKGEDKEGQTARNLAADEGNGDGAAEGDVDTQRTEKKKKRKQNLRDGKEEKKKLKKKKKRVAVEPSTREDDAGAVVDEVKDEAAQGEEAKKKKKKGKGDKNKEEKAAVLVEGKRILKRMCQKAVRLTLKKKGRLTLDALKLSVPKKVASLLKKLSDSGNPSADEILTATAKVALGWKRLHHEGPYVTYVEKDT